MEVAVKPRESKGPLQCAYCHSDDGEVKPCPGNCGSYRHDECKTEAKKCPTMGCIYGVPVDQIKNPPPEIIELAKRMGVDPKELWPPKQVAPKPSADGFFDGLDQPSPNRRPTQAETFFDGLDATAHQGGQSNRAFLDLLSHVEQVFDTRRTTSPSVVREASAFTREPWPDFDQMMKKPLQGVRAELDKVRENIHMSVEELRRELPKVPRPAPPVTTPTPAPEALREPSLAREAADREAEFRKLTLLVFAALAMICVTLIFSVIFLRR